MVAQVRACADRQLQRRHERDVARAGRDQRIEVRMTSHQATHAVDHQAHRDAGACLGREPRERLLADGVATDDERADVDRLDGRVDDAPQRGLCRSAVDVDLQIDVRGRRGLAERGDGPDRPRRIGRRRPIGVDQQRPRLLARPEHQERRQRDVGHEQEEEHPRDGRGRVTPLVEDVRRDDIGQQRQHDHQAVQRDAVGRVDVRGEAEKHGGTTSRRR
jgi:hypothetical protein